MTSSVHRPSLSWPSSSQNYNNDVRGESNAYSTQVSPESFGLGSEIKAAEWYHPTMSQVRRKKASETDIARLFAADGALSDDACIALLKRTNLSVDIIQTTTEKVKNYGYAGIQFAVKRTIEQSLLHAAICAGRAALVEYLLSQNVNINVGMTKYCNFVVKKQSPLAAAMKCQCPEIVMLLLPRVKLTRRQRLACSGWARLHRDDKVEKYLASYAKPRLWTFQKGPVCP